MREFERIYEENRGKKPLFDSITTLGIYDGPTEAVCKLDGNERWFICSMVYYGQTKNERGSERIFSVLELPSKWLVENRLLLDEFKAKNFLSSGKMKKLLKSYYFEYVGNIYLLKCGSLFENDHEMVKVEKNDLRYFKDMPAVMGQSAKSKTKWLSFFNGDDL